MKYAGEGNDEKDERLNPSTAPHAEDVEHADRMEGSYAPGLPEYGPGRGQEAEGTEGNHGAENHAEENHAEENHAARE